MPRYALIIGIGQYRNLSPLSKTTEDAETLARLLEDYGKFDFIDRLPNQWNFDRNSFETVAKPVTGKELGQKLQQFLLERATNSDAVIYYTGHGVTVTDNLGKERAYLAPSDYQSGNPESGISLDSFNELIQQSNLQSLVVLLDCCYGGYFLERSLIRRTLTAFSYQKDYYLITGCRTFENSKALKNEEHSIFSGAIIKGLGVENVDINRGISGDRLFDYISRDVDRSIQEPVRLGWGSAINLITYPQADVAETPKTFNPDNPYLGLKAFTAEDADYFFGRETAIRALIDRIRDNRFLAVIGPSGCGKSSLVKAGLLPELKQDRIPGSSEWYIESLTPGKHPLSPLIEILDRRHREKQPYLLFIDQFEEIFTQCDNDRERESFIHLIAEEAIKNEIKVRIVITIRGDFLDRCAAYPEAAKLVNRSQPTTYMVTELSLPELQAAIAKPADLHGVKFEPGLVLQIAEDVVGEPGALPLLQYALRELWRICIEESSLSQPYLTKTGYQEIGGVEGALEGRANRIYRSFKSDADKEFIQQLFIELVQLDEEKEVTRRRVSRQHLANLADSPAQLEQMLDIFTDNRLLVMGENSVEVAHEALLSKWLLLRNWIERDRENIRIRRRFEAEYREWLERYQKKDNALLTGAKLATVEEWVKNFQPRISDLQAEFLQRSLAQRDLEEQQELEQERQLRELAEAKALAEMEQKLEAEERAKAEKDKATEAEARVKANKAKTRAVSVAGIMVALSLTLALFNQKLEVQKKQNEALAVTALVSKAEQLLETDNQLEALIASVEALEKIEQLKINNEDITEKIKNVINQTYERNRLFHEHPVRTVTSSPDGNKIVSGSADGTLKIWTKDGISVNSIEDNHGHEVTVWSVEFSPDGRSFASASSDKIIKIWSESGEFLGNLIGHTEAVYGLSYSPNGNLIASVGGDGTVKIWDVRTRNVIKEIKNKGVVLKVDFNKDGSKVAFAGADNTINIWNLNEKDSKVVQQHEDSNQYKGRISFITFSPNGEILASSDYDGNINLWDEETYERIEKFETSLFIHGISFSHDSRMLASANTDATIKIWNLEDNTEETLRGHKDEVKWVNFLYTRDNSKVTVSG
ncbi:MAG: caspase family protein, partial [Oscillatoria sp. PMC 1076.18]|nr:caspase family protein [Oscillatoria sp. PMC 1076.18]